MNLRHRFSLLFNIQADEGRLVVLLLAQSFFAGVVRLLVSTMASTLLRDRFGEEAARLLPYVYIGAAVAAPLTTFLYAKLETRLSFSRLLAANLSLLSFSLLAFYGLFLVLPTAGWLALAFYIWYYVLSALITLEFWGLAGRVFTVRQSKRLFGLVGSGLVVATILGGFSIRPLVNLIGASNLLLVAVGSAVICLILLLYTTHLYRTDRPVIKNKVEVTLIQQRPLGGYASLIKDRYIVLMAGLSLLGLLAYYFVDLAFYDQVYASYPNRAELASFLGDFAAIVSIFTLLSQIFVAGPLISRYGLLVSLLALPLILIANALSLVTVGLLSGAAVVVFWLVVAARLLFRGLRDSIDKSAFSILYQPLPADQRLRAQTMIISVVEPVAGGLAGLILLLLTLNTIQLASALLFILAGWISLVILLNRAYGGVLLQALNKNVPGEVSLDRIDNSSMAVLQQGLKSPHPGVVIFSLNTLQELEHESLPNYLREALSHSNPDVRRDALRRIEQLGLTSLWRSINLRLRYETSIPVRAAALRTLAALGQADQLDEIAPYLDETEPQLKQGAMVGLLRSGGIEGILMAGEKLIRQVDSPTPAEREFAARVLGEVGVASFYRPLLKLLQDDNLQVRQTALAAVGKLQHPKLWPLVIENLGQPETRLAATSALVTGGEAALPDIRNALTKENQPREILIRLVRICGRIGGPEALVLLQEQLDVLDADLRYQILRSLSLCDYRAPEPEVGAIQQKLKAEIEHTTWTLAAIADLAPTSPNGPAEAGLGLLQKALEAELAQSQSRMFLLLSFIYEAEAILRARDNLNHSSKETRAYALEVIDNILTSHKLKTGTLKGQELKEIFFPLIDDNLDLSQRLEHLSATFPQPRLERLQRLQEIVVRPGGWMNAWVKVCALEVLGQLHTIEAEAAFITVLVAPEPAIREAATWGLYRLDRVKYQDHLNRLIGDPAPQVAEVARQLAAKNGETSMLSTIEKVMTLKSVNIFAETPEEALAEIVPNLKEVSVEAGRTIFNQGEAGRSMYIIISGRVRIHEGERTLAELAERDIFGELAVLDSEPRSAAATTLTDTRLFRLDQDVLYELMADHIEVARGVIQVLTRRLRRLQNQDNNTQYDFNQELLLTTKKNILMGGILGKLKEENP